MTSDLEKFAAVKPQVGEKCWDCDDIIENANHNCTNSKGTSPSIRRRLKDQRPQKFLSGAPKMEIATKACLVNGHTIQSFATGDDQKVVYELLCSKCGIGLADIRPRVAETTTVDVHAYESQARQKTRNLCLGIVESYHFHDGNEATNAVVRKIAGEIQALTLE